MNLKSKEMALIVSNPKPVGMLEQKMTAVMRKLSSTDTLAKQLPLLMKDCGRVGKDDSWLNEELEKHERQVLSDGRSM